MIKLIMPIIRPTDVFKDVLILRFNMPLMEITEHKVVSFNALLNLSLMLIT